MPSHHFETEENAEFEITTNEEKERKNRISLIAGLILLALIIFLLLY